MSNRNGWRMWAVMLNVQGNFIPYQRDNGTFAVHETRQAARDELSLLRGKYVSYGRRDMYVQMMGAIS